MRVYFPSTDRTTVWVHTKELIQRVVLAILLGITNALVIASTCFAGCRPELPFVAFLSIELYIFSIPAFKTNYYRILVGFWIFTGSVIIGVLSGSLIAALATITIVLFLFSELFLPEYSLYAVAVEGRTLTITGTEHDEPVRDDDLGAGSSESTVGFWDLVQRLAALMTVLSSLSWLMFNLL